MIYNYNDREVRTKIIKDEIYFCAADVGNVLKLKDVHRQVRRFKKGRTNCPTPTDGGIQNIVYINEANLYRLIFKSNREEALDFQDWVFETVIPSIRKTGKYSVPQSLKQISTKNRNALTDAWKECGIKKPYHYINLTREEYKNLGFGRDAKKEKMDKNQLLLLNALEAMEMLNLNIDPKQGYYECKDSLKNTAENVIEYTDKKVVK